MTATAPQNSPDLPLWKNEYEGLDLQQTRIWGLIRAHRGRESAITARKLAGMVQMPERTLRDAVLTLIIEHQKPIGSSMGAPAGYYMIIDPEDLASTTRGQRAVAFGILRRAAALEKTTDEIQFQQAKFEFEGGEG